MWVTILSETKLIKFVSPQIGEASLLRCGEQAVRDVRQQGNQDHKRQKVPCRKSPVLYSTH